MRILLTGKDGQVGSELAAALAPLGELHAFGHAELDLARPEQLAAAVRRLKPHLIANAAAYTAVDRAEDEQEAAFAVNARAPALLAAEAGRLGALLVHYSTDYVFDGTKTSPYVEDDEPRPVNIYGRSKLEGERAIAASGCRHLILRTSWVYAPRGKNFLLTILRRARERTELRVVQDQIGAPTSASLLARATVRLLAEIRAGRAAAGLYHLSAAGATSWYGFAREILRLAGSNASIRPVSSAEYAARARRPLNSRLDCARFVRATAMALPDWRDELARCFEVLRRDAPALLEQNGGQSPPARP